MIEILTASEKEIPIIEDILLDTVRWLDSVGQPLWRENQITWARLSKDFFVSDFQIAFLDGVPAACMAVTGYDPVFWPDIKKGQSLFIHKLAVKRFAAGNGFSDVLIDHAKTMCMDRGIPALRLDCAQDRPKLRAVYEKNGFVCIGERDFYAAGKNYPVAFYKCDVHDTGHLYHYYEKGQTPLRSISALPFREAEKILNSQRERNENLVHPNIKWFLEWRYNMDKTIRDNFITIGGKPSRTAPVFCTLGANRGVSTWFENPAFLRIPITEIDLDTVSFTYGDTMAVFNPKLYSGEEWWGKVYKYDDIIRIIDKYGYPADPEYDGIKGIYPKKKPLGHYLKYIEAHIWSDAVIEKYRTNDLYF